ncbi:MAG: glycosyltransferase [Candidatus Omnitrophota bacterium]
MNEKSIAERNIRLLQEIDPALLQRIERLLKERREQQTPPRFEFLPSPNEIVLCRWAQPSSHGWIHGPADPRDEAEKRARDLEASPCGLAVLWQAGMGYLSRALLQSNPRRRLIVCETRWELFWEWINRWDMRSLFGETPVYLLIGDDPASHLLSLRRRHPSLFEPPVLFLSGSSLNLDEEKQFLQIQEQLQSPSSREPLDESKDTNVFALISNAIPDIHPAVLRGAEANGLRAMRAERSPALAHLLKGKNAWRETCGCVPNVVLGFYGSFFSSKEMRSMGEAGVRRVVWFYDTPNIRCESIAEDYDLALAFDSSHLEILRPLFGDRAQTLSPATAFDQFAPPLDPPPNTPPVAYVGATGLRLSLPYLMQSPGFSARLIQVIRAAVAQSLGESADSMQAQLREETRPFFDENDPIFPWLIYQIAAAEIRFAFLAAAQPYGLAIYGDALWGQARYTGGLTQAYAGRSLKYDCETPLVYAASAINLHINHPQIVDGVPIRIYDVLACGGFLLAEYRPVLEEQFVIGRDLDVFHTPQELREKIEFYSPRKELRRDIGEQGKQTVLANHTYRHRIKELLSMLRLLQN